MHGKAIDQARTYKYLGDVISNDFNNELYRSRLNKAKGYAATVVAMSTEISLGYQMFNVVKLLHQTMFLNGTMVNMETWTHFNEKRLVMFEQVEQQLLRQILRAHSKTPIETLYLEMGVIPFRFHLMKRRILYYYTLMQRSEHELTRKILDEQKKNPLNGDFYKQVQNDMNYLNIDNNQINILSRESLKTIITCKIKAISFEYLICKAKTHNKVKSDIYFDINGCKYFHDKRFQPELSQLIFKLRTRMYGVKANFRNKYKEDMSCPLCNKDVDNQSHLFECNVLNIDDDSNEKPNAVYDDLFSCDIVKVYAAALLVKKLINKRESIIDESLKIN